MHRVQGKENLYKDESSGAVVNADQEAYKMAKQYKRRILEERREKEELNVRIKRLESIVEQLVGQKE